MDEQFDTDVATIRRIDAVPKILDIVCRATGMGFAAVTRVTDERWVACSVRDNIGFGLAAGSELDVATTLCQDIRKSGQPLAIDDVTLDSAYLGHATSARYGFRSYISVPVRLSDGLFFGTLCAIDRKPARVATPETIGMFILFAELIATHIELARSNQTDAASLAARDALLLDERKASELREQFIAVLGHDLRNPLAALAGGVRMLQRTATDEKSTMILTHMQDSVLRMTGLIDNVLDFARGRLGGGFVLERSDAPIEPVLRQVVDEFSASAPDRRIDVVFDLAHPVLLDHNRIAQMVSNLVGNSMMYGGSEKPVQVEARTGPGGFSIAVANTGDVIPGEAIARLFTPFARGPARPNQKGLGLGLYIASEIAKAHDGRIDVTSTVQETRFTVTIPPFAAR